MDLHDQLCARFSAPEWAIFFEVANGLGFSQRRYADAVAMSLFPSRGLDVHGIEVKQSRTDWLRELKDPGKADEIAKYCDYWWLVTGGDKVADKNELPRTWGLLVSNGKELRQVKRAERMKAKAIDRPFMGAMFRRAHQSLQAELKRDSRVVEAQEKGYQSGLAQRDRNLEDSTGDLEKLQKRVKAFEEASGLNIDSYGAGNIGEAVKAFMGYRRGNDVTDDMERAAGWLEDSSKGLREQVALIRKAREAKVEQPAVPQ